MVNLTFTPEEIPKITRTGGSGRAAEPWEDHLAPARSQPGVSFRVWEYAKKMSAVSRLSTVRDRLTKVVPHENWKLVVRAIPDTDPETFGVYVQYDGIYTAEQMAENARLHAERSARASQNRQNREQEQTGPSVPVVTHAPTAGEPTPQERVKAAKAAQTVKAS